MLEIVFWGGALHLFSCEHVQAEDFLPGEIPESSLRAWGRVGRVFAETLQLPALY